MNLHTTMTFHVHPILRLTAIALVLTLATQAQQPTAQPLTFEVATVKPTARTDGNWRLQPKPDGYTGDDISLLHLIQEAYGIYNKNLVTGGPPWVDNDKFDLEGKFDAAAIPSAKNLTSRQRAAMLQPLLADRFHLNVHHETKEFPVYNLVVAKGGPQLKESDPASLDPAEPGCHVSRSGYHGCSMSSLAYWLLYRAGRTVIDKTGLTGLYDYTVAYSEAGTPADSRAAAYPDIFTALQEQLGLKLEPSTAPLDVLVIDSAEKPTAN